MQINKQDKDNIQLGSCEVNNDTFNIPVAFNLWKWVPPVDGQSVCITYENSIGQLKIMADFIKRSVIGTKWQTASFPEVSITELLLISHRLINTYVPLNHIFATLCLENHKALTTKPSLVHLMWRNNIP